MLVRFPCQATGCCEVQRRELHVRALVCVTQLSLCRCCCRCARHFGSKPQSSLRLDCCLFCAHATSPSGENVIRVCPFLTVCFETSSRTLPSSQLKLRFSARRRLLRMDFGTETSPVWTTQRAVRRRSVSQPVPASQLQDSVKQPLKFQRPCGHRPPRSDGQSQSGAARRRHTGTLERQLRQARERFTTRRLGDVWWKSLPPCTPESLPSATNFTQTSPCSLRMGDACSRRSAMQVTTNSRTVRSSLSPCGVLWTTTRGLLAGACTLSHCSLLDLNKETRPSTGSEEGRVVHLKRWRTTRKPSVRGGCSSVPEDQARGERLTLARAIRLPAHKASGGVAFDASWSGECNTIAGDVKLWEAQVSYPARNFLARFAHADDSGLRNLLVPRSPLLRQPLPPCPFATALTSGARGRHLPDRLRWICELQKIVVFARQAERPVPLSAVAHVGTRCLSPTGWRPTLCSRSAKPIVLQKTRATGNHTAVATHGCHTLPRQQLVIPASGLLSRLSPPVTVSSRIMQSGRQPLLFFFFSFSLLSIQSPRGSHQCDFPPSASATGTLTTSRAQTICSSKPLDHPLYWFVVSIPTGSLLLGAHLRQGCRSLSSPEATAIRARVRKQVR